jgi:hypothetical protein
MDSIIIIPRKGGTPRALYHSAVLPVLASAGPVQIRRASRVEPTDSLSFEALHWLRNVRGLAPKHLDPTAWWADLTIVGGPVLGPYNLRETALDAEIAWLNEHGLPFPERATDSDPGTPCP